MTGTTDPFDRAVTREQAIRKRAAIFTSPTKSMKLVIGWCAVLIAVWGLILAGHWILLYDPRWLVVLHTVVFAVTAVCMFLSGAFAMWMSRRQAEAYGQD
jgi:hypothetical protein